MPVDLYTGGIEHAILHLLYSRFWIKVMRDMGLTKHSEPFAHLRNQGMILGEDGEKMSKSRGNVVDPDDLVREYGADTVRTYLMFIAPWELGGPWDPQGINGPAKWLSRVWTLFTDDKVTGPAETVSEADLRFAVHSTLKKVTGDFERLSFNTIIASLMELTNTLVKAKRAPVFGTSAWDEALDIFNRLLAPSCRTSPRRSGRRAARRAACTPPRGPPWTSRPPPATPSPWACRSAARCAGRSRSARGHAGRGDGRRQRERRRGPLHRGQADRQGDLRARPHHQHRREVNPSRLK